jgi:hypothetical protein
MFDPSGDFETIVDGLEPITLRATGKPSVSVPLAHRGNVSAEEAEASNGQLKQSDTVWQWPSDPAEPLESPALGSTILDGALNVWTILAIRLQVLSHAWEAVTRNLAVEAGLNNAVTILRATYTRDASGEAIPTWSVLSSGLRARVQPVDSEADVLQGADQVTAEVRIVLEASAPAAWLAGGVHLRAVDASGNHYTVTGYEQSERVDVLPALLAVAASSVEYEE